MALAKVPFREPPPGVTSNFVNPQTLAPAIDAVSVVMMIWAVTFVVIRLYANTQASRRLRVDDCKSWSVYLMPPVNNGLRLLYRCNNPGCLLHWRDIFM